MYIHVHVSVCVCVLPRNMVNKMVEEEDVLSEVCKPNLSLCEEQFGM